MPKKAKNEEEKKAYRTGYVALIGRPNVGKSTLLNRLLGQKVAIVSDKPQTTRISILGIKTTERGQIIFIDNPGIHKPLHTLNKRMMNFVYSSLETADLLCLLIDATEKFGHGDEFVIETLKNITTPVFLLINKVDAVRKDRILPLIDKYKDLLDFKEIIPVSALKGDNLDVLEKIIYERLPDAEKLYSDDEISDQSEVFLLAEIIREKILNHVKEELPFVTAVFIEEIERRKVDGLKGEAEDGERDEEVSIIVPGLPTEEGQGAQPGQKNGEVSPKAVRENIRAEAVSSEKTAENTAETEKRDGREAGGGEKKPRRPVTYIRASIFVERDNHRKIIIGRHGKLIKMIGIEARREIEEILESKVFLELHVRVKPRWRDSEDVLDLIEGQKG